MGRVADIILKSHVRMRMMSEKLLVGIAEKQFARLGNVGGKTVESNHPAWVYGHLAVYPSRVLTVLGSPAADSVAVSPAYVELFKDGTKCLDDVEGRIYPRMEEIAKAYFIGHDALAAFVATLPDEALLRDHPDEARRVNFPVLGAHVNFMLNDHIAFHLGQVSAWRRMMGLGSAT
jgi:hypothetical protein